MRGGARGIAGRKTRGPRWQCWWWRGMSLKVRTVSGWESVLIRLLSHRCGAVGDIGGMTVKSPWRGVFQRRFANVARPTCPARSTRVSIDREDLNAYFTDIQMIQLGLIVTPSRAQSRLWVPPISVPRLRGHAMYRNEDPLDTIIPLIPSPSPYTIAPCLLRQCPRCADLNMYMK